MILSDKQIKKLANEDGMISPFVSKSIYSFDAFIAYVFGR